MNLAARIVEALKPIKGKRTDFFDREALVTRYIDAREPVLAISTAREYRRMARVYLDPLARVPLSDPRGADIDACQHRAAKRNGPIAANRLFQFMRSVCRFGWKKNPCGQLHRESWSGH
jgi:hypothetical protein